MKQHALLALSFSLQTCSEQELNRNAALTAFLTVSQTHALHSLPCPSLPSQQVCCADLSTFHTISQPSTLHSLPCPSLQSEQVCCAELEAAKAALQCEALRLALTAVGCQLRTLFNWLHSVWYQLEGLAKVRAFGTTARGVVNGQHGVGMP